MRGIPRLVTETSIEWDGNKLYDAVPIPPLACPDHDFMIELDDSDNCGQDLTGTLQVPSGLTWIDLLMPSTIELDTWEAPSIPLTKGTHKIFGPLPGSILGSDGLQLTLTAASAPTNEKETVIKIHEVVSH